MKEVPIAEKLAKEQRSISISEFFLKNKHLLGFDNPRKALLTTIKEAVDNSLDACEEAKILPDIKVKVEDLGADRFKVVVEDNGPGIVKQQIPRIFGKLLYGSKFYSSKQSLTGDEPIFIKRNNKIEIIPIEVLVDSFLNNNETIKDISNMNIKVPAFDIVNNKYSLKNVSHVIRHKRENEILRIRTDYNKEIKITGCHSLFIYNRDKGRVESVEARSLQINDYIIVPKKLPEIDNIQQVNILNYISYRDIKNNWVYIYGIKDLVKKLKDNSKIIYKKVDKSRRFYRIEHKGNKIDILDNSLKQYLVKGFLPLSTIYRLNLIEEISEGHIVTYKHGKKFKLPIILQLNKEFLRFLGLYVAEGHSDKRQLGLTFGKHEQTLINEIIRFAQIFGLGFTIEPRERSIRIKLFKNLFVKFIENICCKGAFNKKIPEFVFRTNEELRWHFIDAYCQGDGHKEKGKNYMKFTTKSKTLAINLQYLFLMSGVTSTKCSNMEKGLGKKETVTHRINISSYDLNKSHIYSRNNSRPTNKKIFYNFNKAIGTVQQEVNMGDLAFVKIKEIEFINEGYEYVYDISVPKCENFVGGIGGISCHNSRGQQGLGISSAAMYGQLTTGKPITIVSKIQKDKPAHNYELQIDTKKNEPQIIKEQIVDWDKDHGTKIKIDLEAKYQKGKQGIDEYLKQTAIVNPHLNLIYINPEKHRLEFPRASKELPKEPKEIKPHPYGVELGILIKMLQDTKAITLQSFLQNDFCRVSAKVAKEICQKAGIYERSRPSRIAKQEAENVYKAIQEVKIIAPPTDCVTPIGEELILKGLKKEINAEFYASITRPPSVYRGNPFIIEAGIAYGGDLPKDDHIKLLRFANRVPLQYQQSAGAITKSVLSTVWRNYGLSQSRGALPIGPVVLLIHIASVWVPFTSESKEAIAHYPEIIKEIKLALQDVGRKLGIFIRKRQKAKYESEKKSYIEKYIPHIGIGLKEILDLKEEDEKKIIEILKDTLERSRK